MLHFECGKQRGLSLGITLPRHSRPSQHWCFFHLLLVLRVFCLLCHHSGAVVALDDPLHQSSPIFLAPGTSFMEQFFHGPGVGEMVSIIQVPYIYCTIYFCYFYISSTSGHSIRSWRLGTSEPDVGKDWRQDVKGTTGWDGWMPSLTQWTWVWVDSGSWWWTGRPGMLQSWGREESDTTEQINWVPCLLSCEPRSTTAPWSLYLKQLLNY